MIIVVLIFVEATLLGISAAMKLDDDFIKNINISKHAQSIISGSEAF
jgi:hypothetical protein